MNQKRLRPIVMTINTGRKFAQNHSQQVVLLKALQVTQDPRKLKEMMGVRTVAEVYRTLDKMSLRKEYHAALQRAGFTFDSTVKGIMDIAQNSEKDDTRLKAHQVLLKSLGLDKYDASDMPSGGTWEEELLKSIEKSSQTPEALPSPEQDYVVEVPEVPEHMKKLRQEEEELTKSIYERRET